MEKILHRLPGTPLRIWWGDLGMDPRYGIANQCLQQIKKIETTNNNRLRVEIKLIQVKRLLLHEAVSDQAGSCGINEFEDLLGLMLSLCEGNCGEESFAELMNRLALLLTALGGPDADLGVGGLNR